MSGTINLPHTCPKCRKTRATTHQELIDLFGFRNLPSGASNQSWCKKCRSTQSN